LLAEESKIYINSKDIFNQDIKAILTAKPDSWSNMADERGFINHNKFVRLIEETKPYAMRGLRHANWRERDLQECIIRYARKLGYRAIHEDILKVDMPHHQPLMDVVVEIDSYLHAAELKIMDIEKFQYFEGLDQALAYSLNGVDYSWLVHYLTSLSLPFIPNVAKWASPIEHIFITLGIKQIGYLLVDSGGLKCMLKPTKPIEHNDQSKELRQRIDRMLRLKGLECT
jgi:hypothetical protein